MVYCSEIYMKKYLTEEKKKKKAGQIQGTLRKEQNTK